jgi:beta-lactamase regulating signal transducer with metallopeptidase domain
VTTVTDTWVEPGLAFLAGWSVRWGVAIGLLAAAFVLRPPRRAGTRALLAHLTLWGGLALPVAPVWGPTVVRPAEPVVEPAAAARILAARDTRTPIRSGPPADASVPISVGASQAVAERPPPGPTKPNEAAPTPAAMAVPARAVEPIGAPRWLMLGLAVAWVLGVALMLLRLASGWRWLARLRRSARPVGPASLALLAECRAALRVRRAVDLAAHPDVGSPVLVGGRRPVVLVPPGWEGLSEPARRLSLLHELAHLARGDDWARLAQELVRAAFFFHPLVHWLLARLDREREQLCDEAVIRRGVAPRALAGVLFDFARRTAGRPAAVALPFFRRGTVKDRIEHLLEDDVMRWLTPLPRRRALALSAAVLTGLLALGGFAVRAVTPEDPPKSPHATAKADDKPVPAGVSGVVLDPDDRPVAGALVVLGGAFGEPELQSTTSDAEGRFTFPQPRGPKPTMALSVLAGKEGYAPAAGHAQFEPSEYNRNITLKLAKLREYVGSVADRQGRPVAGARVQFGTVQRYGNTASWGFAPEAVMLKTPLDAMFSTTTGEDGRFRLTHVTDQTEIILRVTSLGMTEYRDLPRAGFDPKAGTTGQPAAVVLEPEATIRGRIVSRIAGVGAGGHTVAVREVSQERWGGYQEVKADADGHFTVHGLGSGKVLLTLTDLTADGRWTARAQEITLTTGTPAAATFELVEGVLVEGRVCVNDDKAPAAGVEVWAYGSANPRGSLQRLQAKTDRDGRYHFRLPAGPVEVAVNALDLVQSRSPGAGGDKAVIPEGVKSYTVPDQIVARVQRTGLEGWIVDATGRPVPGARLVGICRSGSCQPFGGPKVVSDNQGRFRLAGAIDGPFALGQTASLQVVTAKGQPFEVAVIAAQGEVEVRLPTLFAQDVKGPVDVKPDELAGAVVDPGGKPLEGVEVDAWDWYPGNETKTDANGVFRLPRLGRDRKVQVRFRKPGYSPVMIVQQPTGVKDLVIVLDQKTYFEGRVLGPDGQPAAHAVIRADQGPKQGDGVIISHVWTETKSDAEGRYRLYVEPDGYEFHVKAPGAGVARLPRTSIGHGQAQALDIRLHAGVTFRAVCVDSQTGLPVAGVRLSSFQHKDVQGRSDAAGQLAIPEMLPGRFEFSKIEVAGYTRWWSEQCTSEWNRPMGADRRGFQRNFDYLDFDLKPDMAPVKIVLERGVRFRGKVLDPDGKLVAGATVAPALTGTGNSLTGDTRFSVATKADGTFDVLLPASGLTAEYNLVVHDGKYGQWRDWANGVLPPVRTLPGQEYADLVLTLTRPAVVRGKVVDAAGKPVARREVRAHAADKCENRYYDPTTRTKEDGTFELRFVRPGEHHIQAAPFWLDAEQAPGKSTRKLTLKEGETVEKVELVAEDQPNG